MPSCRQSSSENGENEPVAPLGRSTISEMPAGEPVIQNYQSLDSMRCL